MTIDGRAAELDPRVDRLAAHFRLRLRSAGFKLAGGEWIGSDGAALVLELTERTLRAWRRAGTGPEFFRVGASAIYSIHALAEWSRTHGDFRKTEAFCVRSDRRYRRANR